MEVFRLARAKYGFVLSGQGAAIKGARWNSVGTELVYTAASRALAMAEVLVHFSAANMLDDYHMLTIYVPDDLPTAVCNDADLPDGWNTFPSTADTQHIGDKLVRTNQHTLLRVPSVVVPGDYNYLLNPFHPRFAEIKILKHDPFSFDNRLFR